MLKHLTRQGNIVVARDEEGKPVKALALSPRMKPKSIQKMIAEVTGDNLNNIVFLNNVVQGKPFIPTLDDGREGEPMFPTFEVRRAAAINLLEYSVGKPVAITEMTAAAIDQDLRAKYEAMSSEDLEAEYLRLKAEEEKLETLERVEQKALT